jgi:transposase InsO family protein
VIIDPDKERPSDHLKQWHIVPGTITSSTELLPSDDTEDQTEETELVEPEIQSGPLDEEDYLNVTIKGTDTFKEQLSILVHKYKDVFASKLPEEPARVTPMTFKVDQENWIKPATRQSYRRQTVLKDAEVVLKISTLLKCGAIKRSSARAWSQVLLTPKPNNKWRFCIDFRLLNDATSPKGWPLPRIKELVHRIGHHKPQWFGKMDLTDGYFQMPLAVNSRENTAFITSQGLYEWTRVPIGLKNAAAYFQEVITQEVLAGLVMHTCEVYIDDIAIHAATEEQFLTRLEEILLRFRKHNVKLQGKKCEFGLTEIEVLGHVIDSTGVTFSGEKLRGVDDTLLPTTGTKLLSFLGLANYFRDNVRNIHVHEGPLRQLASAHPKSSIIKWTPTLEDHFEQLKKAVWSCTKVHFVDDSLPIFLHTDACDHGIGAYLFQLGLDGKEIPIGFLSRSLRGAETRWSTFEQEGFAIYKALEKFEYLLRDAQFTIRTDHRNLLFMNEKASNKVLRWKNAIQQYNFVVEHIPGVDNIVADLYSRLNSLHTDTERSDILPTPVSAILASMTTDIPYITELRAYKVRKELLSSPDRSQAFLAAKKARLKPSTAHEALPVTLEHQELLKKVHNFKSGHAGVERTLQRLHDTKVKWPGMRQDVTKFIHQCPACQLMRESRIKILVKPFHLSVFNPMERLNIDSIGPLPTDAEGHEHILVIIDVFSRFVELVPCKDLTAASATRALLAHIGRYGSPGEVLTDNGPQFIADVTQQLLQVMDTLPLTILPYSHEENGIVERVNKEVIRHLRAILYDKQIKDQWSLVLPLVQRIHNATPHSSTNVAPAHLIFGHTLDLDRGILHERKADKSETWHEYINTLLNAQARIIAVAQQTQRILNTDNIVRRTNVEPTEFEPGSYVLMTHYQYKDGVGSKRPSKLDMNYRGPFLVVSNDITRYSLQNLVTGDTFDTHVTTLQPFHFDPKVVDPKIVARQAAGEFIVDTIIEIRGTKNPKSRRFYRTGLELLVKWSGYDESYNSWEPYKELRFNIQFHEFCIKERYQYLIPTNLDIDIVEGS